MADDISYGFNRCNQEVKVEMALDGTRSSTNESIKSDSTNMSYLYGRDPSILAYGQRPFPAQQSKKNLNSLYEEEEEDEEADSKTDTIASTDGVTGQTVKVFLRMKPFPRKMKLTPQQMEAYTIMNSTTLLTKLPCMDNNTSCLKKLKTVDAVSRKFTFTQTFKDDTSQRQLFNEVVKPQMDDLLSGKSSIVMTYGTTNSGKSFTLQGTTASPGIIPRGLRFVFKNIDPRPTACYKPVHHNDVIALNQVERSFELESTMKLISFSSFDKNQHTMAYKDMQKLLEEESPLRRSQCHDAHYSVWVTFAEIYNETIYDLLSNECQKRRPPLKLATDSRGRAFIKGLKAICVNSGSEAYQVLMAGQYNLKVAATALNSRSSRSHCIFTIKLLKYKTENDPESVEVSTFAFCDLAGSERLKKTLNVGDRLKEAQNINTSLLVLGRCLKTIYETQSTKQKNESIGPFRESKLTRLFQRALSGKENIALIVNVNPLPNLYIETQNVLNFSAIAKKIIIERVVPSKKRKSRSRFSQLVTQSIRTVTDWDSTDLPNVNTTEGTEPSTDIDCEGFSSYRNDYDEVMNENEQLKKELEQLKNAALTRDMKTRKEMADLYTEMINKLEQDWKDRMLDMEEQQEDLRELAIGQVESFYKQKLKKMNLRKRSRSSDGEDELNSSTTQEALEADNTRLQLKVDSLKKTIRDLKVLIQSAQVEKNKLLFEAAIAKDEVKHTKELLQIAQDDIASGDDAAANHIENLTATIGSKNERIKKLKEFLDEAKDEYIEITSYVEEMEQQVKKQNDLLAERDERVTDLEESLNYANICLAEKCKNVESLEEELESQSKKLLDAEEKLKNITDSFNELRTECKTIKLEGDGDHKDNEKPRIEELVHNVNVKEENSLILSLQMKIELSEAENVLLNEKLDQKNDKIQELETYVNAAKGQLHDITEKVKCMTIASQTTEQITCERDVQTENACGEENISKINSANISCQTIDMAAVIDEKSIQTSFSCSKIEELEETSEKAKEVEAKLTLEKGLLQTRNVELEAVVHSNFEEKTALQNLLNTCNAKIEILQEQLSKYTLKELEKDQEISCLQRELKNSIQARENDVMSAKLEKELKAALRDLASAEENLTTTRERYNILEMTSRQRIHELEIKLEVVEQNTKIMEILQKTIDSRQKEIDGYKRQNYKLQNSLQEREIELQNFTKNRDDTVHRYENLVKSQTEELEREKREVIRLQEIFRRQAGVTPSTEERHVRQAAIKEEKAKTVTRSVRKPRRGTKVEEIIENTSDEEILEDTSSKKTRAARKEFLSPPKDDVHVIELSESESKKSTKSSTLDPPTSSRRPTRRKKLFAHLDESNIDIEQSEPSPSPKPIPRSRNLRNRKK